jgi:hypothetical protein
MLPLRKSSTNNFFFKCLWPCSILSWQQVLIAASEKNPAQPENFAGQKLLCAEPGRRVIFLHPLLTQRVIKDYAYG